MRVGLFISSWDPQINGVITSVKELQSGLQALGVDAYVITSGNVEKPTIIGKVVYLPGKENKRWNTNSINFLSEENINFVSRLGLSVVHTHQENTLGFLGAIIAKRNNIPHVSTWHTCYYDYKHYVLYNLFYIETIMEKIAARKYCGKKVQAVITPSKKIADYLKRKLKIYHEPHIIETGIHLNFDSICDAEKQELRDELGIEKDDFIVSYIGRVAKEKNIEFLIEAQIPLNTVDKHIKLLIVGDGPELSHLKKYVTQLGLQDRVIFTGKIPHEEVYKYYQISDVFATASTTETQGLSVLEALSNGVPVCCIKDDAYKYIMKNNYNGMMFSNIQGYVNAILDFRNKDLTTLKKNAIKSSRKYDNISFASEVLKVYRECIAKKKEEDQKRR